MKKATRLVLLAGAVVFAFSGCSAISSLFGTDTDGAPVHDLVSTLRDIEQPGVLEEPEVVDPESEPVQDGDYLCTTTRYRATAEYDELLVLDPTTDVIYPGAILKGESIETGEYIPVIADRAPMTISVSLENLSGDVSRTIAEPKLSTVRQAIREILNQGTTGATPAHMTFVKERVYSEEHLRLSLGAHYNYSSGVADVRTSFGFDNETTRTRILVKFLQKYYTIDMDPPASADELFGGAVAAEDFGAATPVYVSTVTFGRLVLFAIESGSEYEEVSAALDAAFSSGAHSGDLQLSVEHERLLRSSSIKGTIIGGSGSDAAGTINGLDARRGFSSREETTPKTRPAHRFPTNYGS